MKTKTVKTQKQYDSIKKDFDGVINIVGGKDLNIDARPNATIYVSGSAVIKRVSGSAVIKRVSGSAVIKRVYDSAVIEFVYDSAVIEFVYDSAVIKFVYGSAVIKFVYGSAVIEDVFGSAVIKFVYGYASINFIADKAQINCFGQNTVRYFETEKNIKLKFSKNTTVIKLKRIEPTFNSYKTLYPVTVKGTNAIFYKAVHKIKDGEYHANYDEEFKYKLGETITHDNDPKTTDSCSYGLHVSHKWWATNFGRSWNVEDFALLEVSVPIKDIVVSTDCDGKVRTSKLKVLREVPESEW